MKSSGTACERTLDTICPVCMVKPIHPVYQGDGMCEDCLAAYWALHRIQGSCSFAGRALPLRKHELTAMEKAVYKE
jgi:hypothetical protein